MSNEDGTDAPMRFSAPAPAKQGNVLKYEAYAEARERIKRAIAAGFYLEAITLAESIMSDRLVSYLARANGPIAGIDREKRLRLTFGRLIAYWRQDSPGGALLPTDRQWGDELIKKGTDLIQLTNDWRVDRNRTLHEIVKSDPGEPSIEVTVFLRTAQVTAVRGRYLVQEILNWHAREKRLLNF